MTNHNLNLSSIHSSVRMAIAFLLVFLLSSSNINGYSVIPDLDLEVKNIEQLAKQTFNIEEKIMDIQKEEESLHNQFGKTQGLFISQFNDDIDIIQSVISYFKSPYPPPDLIQNRYLSRYP